MHFRLCDYDGKIKRPHINCLPNAVRKKSLVGDSQWKAVQEFLPPEWAKCVCVSGFLTSGVNQLTGWTSTRASQIHLPSHFLCAGNPNKTKAGPESNKSTHARPNQHDCRGSSQSHLPSMCICFAPCITGVFVLDLTWFFAVHGGQGRYP